MAKNAIKPDANAPQRIEVKRLVQRAPTFVSIYANDVQVQTTPWDVRFVWGEIAEAASIELPETTIRQLGEVRLSLGLAKVLSQLLIQQLTSYEQQVGPIPTPSAPLA